MENSKKLGIFIQRMDEIGIKIELSANYPWIYLDSINGKRVTEKFHAEHGFTIAFLPIKCDQELNFLDIKELFNLIRKYI